MNTTTRRIKERGVASLMVTTILMLVISLIVIGFSQVARRNQEEALNRQLSSQAFYATESGINAAVAIIRNKAATNQPIPEKTSCAPDANYPAVRLSGDNVRVTCMLVEPNVPTLAYDGVAENTSTVVPVVPVAGSVGSISLTWRSASGGASSSCTGTVGTAAYLPQRAGWSCPHGLLRVDLSGQPTGGTSDADLAKTFFFYPEYQSAAVTETTTTVNSASWGGGIMSARCSGTGSGSKCMATITGLNASAYYLNLRSLYQPSDVTINGRSVGAGAPLDFTGQVKIDVTAKSTDVYKRSQVRVPVRVQQPGGAPAYGIETSESICKRFSVAPSYYVAENVWGCVH